MVAGRFFCAAWFRCTIESMSLARIARTLRMGAVLVSLGLSVGAGCGGGSGGSGAATISSQTLSGKVAGQPWTLMTGQTDAFFSDADRYGVDAYSQAFTACTGTPPTGVDFLILNLPKTVGTYSLGLDLTETFSLASGNSNLAAASGRLVISAVSATTISGGANFAYDADNSVDGQFELTVCP